MTDQLQNVLNSLNQQLASINRVQLFIGILIIIFYAWTRFNTWPAPKSKSGKSPPSAPPPNPPRHYTTFLRYFWYSMLYLLAMESIYLIIVLVPGVYDVLAATTHTSGSLKNLPLWSLVFLTTIMPNSPYLREIEWNLHKNLHTSAFIPREAMRLAQEFHNHPGRFQVSEGLVGNEFLKDIQDEIVDLNHITRPDRRLRHRWFKLRYLSQKISEWRTRPESNHFIGHCGAEIGICEENLDTLRAETKDYYQRRCNVTDNSQDSAAEKEYLCRLRKNLERKIDIKLQKAYLFISCAALATEKTKTGRTKIFNYFGLYPLLENGPPILIDLIIICVLVVSLITFIATGTFFWFSVDHFIAQELGKVFSWTFIMLLVQGISITVAMFIYNIIILKLVKANKENNLVKSGVISHICIGVIAAYLPAFLIILIFSYSQSEDPTSWFTIAKRILPWPLIPASTAGFIIYYLSTLDKKISRWTEAVIQAAIMALVGATAYTCYISFQSKPIDQNFLLYISSLCFFMGGAIGAIFPQTYRNRIQESGPIVERRSDQRVSLVNDVILTVAGNDYQCKTMDLSIKGTKVAVEASLNEGDQVVLSVPDLGHFSGTIKFCDKKSTSISFNDLEEQVIQKLKTYLGLLPAVSLEV